jgi:hypothetical protein
MKIKGSHAYYHIIITFQTDFCLCICQIFPWPVNAAYGYRSNIHRCELKMHCILMRRIKRQNRKIGRLSVKAYFDREICAYCSKKKLEDKTASLGQKLWG